LQLAAWREPVLCAERGVECVRANAADGHAAVCGVRQKRRGVCLPINNHGNRAASAVAGALNGVRRDGPPARVHRDRAAALPARHGKSGVPPGTRNRDVHVMFFGAYARTTVIVPGTGAHKARHTSTLSTPTAPRPSGRFNSTLGRGSLCALCAKARTPSTTPGWPRLQTCFLCEKCEPLNSAATQCQILI